MKHLHDDELLMSALDGIDDLDLNELDARQAKEFQALSLLKSDLKLLNDIPECQLSSDRLRRRILEDGIQAKAQPRGWFWFASAGAISCACMAAAAVMVWNYYQPAAVPVEPQTLVQATEVAPTLESLRFDDPWSFVESDPILEPTPTQAVPEAAKAVSKPEAKTGSSKPLKIRTSRPVMTVVSAAAEGVGMVNKKAEVQTPAPKEPAMISSETLSGMDLTAPGAETASNPSASGAAAKAPTVGSKPSSVVVISQASTPEPKVESAGHVVFGG